ncbi:MAG TPA: thiamine pyrophosphate-binding protein [Chthonomonadaceae bacterium]|nr:thiamine pyrophosphate-binding protein [Chthonomonadaceae bacterium]
MSAPSHLRVVEAAPQSAQTGRFAILEQFLADGFRFMFGNPGTVEQGFLDALADTPDLRYILTLQESVAVLMADGYARATQRPALVQIHSTPGLGNAIGALYQAKRGHSPLVVIGGDAGIRYQAMDAQMAGDLVAMAEPVTKWATMVMDPASLLRVLRRAIKIAATPPMGPVYVCLPMDILDAPVVEEVFPTSLPSTRTAPDESLLRQAAQWLAAAELPMLFVGDGIAFSQAQAELTEVAELLGAEVWEADAGEVNFSYAHPLYQGMTGHMFGYHSLPITQKGDVNLICGTYMLPEVFPELGDIFAPGAKTIHIDLNAYEIAKNHPVDIGMASDPKRTLARLAAILKETMTPEQQQAALARLTASGQAKQQRLAAEKAQDVIKRDAVPLAMARFMEELAPALPQDALLFDEALTNSPAISRYWPPTATGQYFLTRGGSLGIGIPGAVGAKLAHPDKTVFGFTGDGGSMYTIQALWTAARHNVAAKFVICNNASYRLLQLNIDAYWKERSLPKHDFPLSFDLSRPAIRFDEMARAMGVQAVRVEKPEEIQPAIQQALAHPGPFLIDLVLEGDTHPDRVGNTCGQ